MTEQLKNQSRTFQSESQANESRNSALHGAYNEFPIFTGENDDFDEFICNFKHAAHFYEWSSTKQAQVLPLYLKGTASRWFNSLVHKNILSLNKMIEQLREEF